MPTRTPLLPTSLALALALALAACGGTASEPPTTSGAPPSATDILDRVTARYNGAKTYRDEGTMHMSFVGGKKTHSVDARLRTRWVAPDRMRFAYGSNDGDDAIVVVSRGGVTNGRFLGKDERYETLHAALFTYQGVSSGTTGLAPSWLAGRSRPNEGYSLRGKEPCGRATCFVLERRPDDSQTYELWIDERTYGLRKYRARVHAVPDAAELRAMVAKMPPEERDKVAPSLEQASQPFDVDSTIELDPTFDAPIDDAELG